MKTVKITMDVVVPDGCTYIAVDSDCEIYAYFEKPKLHVPEYSPNDGYWYSSDSSKDEKLVPINWCESLVKVNQ